MVMPLVFFLGDTLLGIVIKVFVLNPMIFSTAADLASTGCKAVAAVLHITLLFFKSVNKVVHSFVKKILALDGVGW